METLAQDISRIEDWENYQVDISLFPNEPNESELTPLTSIKESLTDALSIDVTSDADSTCRLLQSRKLRRVFKAWKEALNGRRLDTPHLLISLLEETYVGEEEIFTVSSFRGKDRLLLFQIAPIAKAFGFNLHIAEVEYYEDGYPMTVPRAEFLEAGGSLGQKPEIIEDTEVEDEDGVPILELRKLDPDSVENWDFSFLQVSTLDGVPIDLTGPGLDKIESQDRRGQFVVHGKLTEREPHFEVQGIEIGFVQFEASGNLEDQVYHFFRKFKVGDDVQKADKVAQSALKWLDGKSGSEEDIPGIKRVTACVCKYATQRKDLELFERVLDACGPEHILSFLGISTLLGAATVFSWCAIEHWYTRAVKNDVSNACRAKLIRDLEEASGNQDIAVYTWCGLQKGSFFENLGKVHVLEIDTLVQLVLSYPEPLPVLRERLYKTQGADMKTYLLLFDKMRATESFDQSDVLSIIVGSIRHLATTINPFQFDEKASCYNDYRYSVGHLIDLVTLAVQYQAGDAISALLERLWQETSNQNNKHTVQYYEDLVLKLDGVAKSNPEYQGVMVPFFGQAFEILLCNYTGSTERDRKLRAALEYERDPLKHIAQCLFSYLAKRASQPVSDRYSEIEMVKFVNGLRLQSSLESEELFQRALQLLVTQSIESLDLTPLSKEAFDHNFPAACTVKDCIMLCLVSGSRDGISRLSDRLLKAPQGYDPAYIQHGLASIVTSLPAAQRRHGLSADIGPLTHLVGEVTKRYMELCVGEPPVPGISLQGIDMIGCGCQNCKQSLVPIFMGKVAKTPLRGSPSSRVEIRSKAQVKAHFEERLAPTYKWGVRWRTDMQKKSKRSHVLQIDIPSVFDHLPEWSAKAQRGQEMLSVLGGIDQQRQALGDDYARVFDVLYATGTSAPKRPAENDESTSLAPSKKARMG
ncbi:hypothetical protein VNI00_007681 [Paramarasmius palmivorus]|uniref:Uncharacterized protein n=1 Tax=Paramarasmius palmivorus TaxID=297713 RepID=A0AAW0CZT5_9AGAR